MVHFNHETLEITLDLPEGQRVIRHHDVRESNYSGGHGGQNVNKHQAGVQLIYVIPPELRRPEAKTQQLIVRCMSQRHQHQNRIIAFHWLAQKLEDYFRVLKPRVATRPTGGSRQKRFRKKQLRGLLKQSRQKPLNF